MLNTVKNSDMAHLKIKPSQLFSPQHQLKLSFKSEKLYSDPDEDCVQDDEPDA